LIRFDIKNRQHQEAIRSLATLQHNSDFRAFYGFLHSTLDNMRIKNDTLSGDSLKWNQGKCQLLQEILLLPGMAREIIHKNS